MKHALNSYRTTDLTLSVMAQVAYHLKLNINDDQVADRLYDVCCGLESFPKGEGFGSSDTWSYVRRARREFNLPEVVAA